MRKPRLDVRRCFGCESKLAMADSFSNRTRSRIMSAIRKRGNKSTELRLAEIFRAHRIIGWRRHCAVFGHPDFVFQRLKIAVFVDGCFWHGCRWHFRPPRSNRSYWNPKLARNRKRDRLNSTLLRKQGWLVLRLWEHQLSNAVAVAGHVMRALEERHGGACDCGWKESSRHSARSRQQHRPGAQRNGAGDSSGFSPPQSH